MPTIFTHAAPALAMRLGLGKDIVPRRLLVCAVLCAMLPDLDVIGFKLGITYAAAWGHRGASHSLMFAFGLGLFAACLALFLRCRAVTAFVVISLAVLSHIALDAMTSGGLGVAAFWPWHETRYFLSWRPIRVSPFSPSAFLSARGAAVLTSELLWVWLPCLAGACLLWLARWGKMKLWK
jgi:inner membrane protein